MTTEAERLGEEIKRDISNCGLLLAATNERIDILVALAQGAQDPVAVVGGSFQLLWLGGSSFSEHVRKHGIKVGTKLYAHPKETQT